MASVVQWSISAQGFIEGELVQQPTVLGHRPSAFRCVVCDSSDADRRLWEAIMEDRTINFWSNRLPNRQTILLQKREDELVAILTEIPGQCAVFPTAVFPLMRQAFLGALPAECPIGRELTLNGVGGLPTIFIPDQLWSGLARFAERENSTIVRFVVS